MPFKTPLDVRGVRGKEDKFILLAPLVYVTRSGRVLTVPAGFETDFASVPWGFRNVFPKAGRYRDAAALHDFLYRCCQCVFTREEADALLLEAMEELRVPAWQRYPMYWAVRAGGGKYWKRKSACGMGNGGGAK